MPNTLSRYAESDIQELVLAEVTMQVSNKIWLIPESQPCDIHQEGKSIPGATRNSEFVIGFVPLSAFISMQ